MAQPVEVATEPLDAVTEFQPRRPTALQRKNARRTQLEMFAFAAPALIVFVLFVFLPVGLAFGFSFFDGTRTNPLNEYIGFDNFVSILTAGRMFGQPYFWDAVRNNVFIGLASLLVQGPIALGVALLLNRKLRFRQVFRLLIFVPYVLSEVITGVIFNFVLAGDGVLDIWLERIWVVEPTVVARESDDCILVHIHGYYLEIYRTSNNPVPCGSCRYPG